MKELEPSLESLEDYQGKERLEKKLTVWVVILSGLLIGAVYSIVKLNTTWPADAVSKQEATGIFKY